MPEITIQNLREEYENFKREAVNKITEFRQHSSRYFTFIEDCQNESWFSRREIQVNLSEIEKAYAFIKMLKDVYSLRFPQMIIEYAKSRGFEPRHLITEINYDAMLAIDLALHYRSWGQETYNNHDFIGIGFSRQESVEGISLSTGAFVPFLNIRVDAQGNLLDITPYSWNVIESFISGIIPPRS